MMRDVKRWPRFRVHHRGAIARVPQRRQRKALNGKLRVSFVARAERERALVRAARQSFIAKRRNAGQRRVLSAATERRLRERPWVVASQQAVMPLIETPRSLDWGVPIGARDTA